MTREQLYTRLSGGKVNIDLAAMIQEVWTIWSPDRVDPFLLWYQDGDVGGVDCPTDLIQKLLDQSKEMRHIVSKDKEFSAHIGTHPLFDVFAVVYHREDSPYGKCVGILHCGLEY